MASRPPSTGTALDREFLKAHELFFNTLSPNERQQFRSCKSAEELLDEAMKLSHFREEKKNWARPLECIQRFSEHLAPYLNIIGTFVQSNPTWSAIAWGAVRFVLQLADNFSTFFNKLTEILDQVGRALPRYKEINTVAPDDISARFRSSLVDLYRDLFEFFTSVARVFTQKSGKLRRTPVVITQLLWKPFSVRYDNFLKKLEFHCTVMEEEEKLMQTKTLFQVKKSQDAELHLADEHRQRHGEYQNLVRAVEQKVSAAEFRAICDSITTWLGVPLPDEVQEPLWDAQRLRERNTASWIFNHPDYVSWNEKDPDHCSLNDTFSNALWVQGNPGAGKSVLAASVLDQLQTSGSVTGDWKHALVYFFFSFRSAASRRRFNAYQEIVSQIFLQLQNDDEVMNCFTFAASKAISTRASPADLLALLKLLAQRIPRLTLLLDGVDESEDPDDIIQSLVTCFAGTRAKMIIFSRPNIHTLLSTQTLIRITLSRQSVEDDIRLYLSRRLGDLLQRKLPPGCDREQILVHLLDSANGMFLWARLMMDYLDSPALNPPENRLATIWKTTKHESLGDMYIRILRLIATKIKPEREIARRILYWLAFHCRSLDRRELWEAIYCLKTASPPPGLTSHLVLSKEEDSDFDRTIVMICACFVEKYGSGYRLIHQSVVEFFWTWAEEFPCNDPDILQFLLEPAEAHSLLAQECLSYLICRIPAEPLSGDMRQRLPKERIDDGFPFSRYATLYWARHLKECMMYVKSPTQCNSPSVTQAFVALLRTLSEFVASKLFVNTWVELQYMVCSHTTLPSHIDDLEEWCGLVASFLTHIPEDLRELYTKLKCLHRDMSALNSRWGPTLGNNPHYIWNDVTAFEEGSSFMKTSAVTVRSMAPSEFGDSTLTSTPLVHCSREGRNGDIVAVLTIWPNRSFQEAWPKASDANTRDLPCEGWVARFETWNVRSGTKKDRVNDIRFQLNESEVKAHINKSASLIRVSKGRTNRTTPTILDQWLLPFPLEISNDLDVFIILNTTYILDLTSSQIIQHIRLPTIETEAEEGTGMKQTKKPARPLSVSLRMAHTHSFLMSNNGRYIFRQDAKCIVTAYVGNPVVHSLTAIVLDKSKQISHIIGQFGGRDAGVDINSCTIHPTLPLALFYTRSFAGGRSVMLWAFSGASRGDSHPNSPVSDECRTISTLGPPLVGIEELAFSDCGTNVIVKSTGKRLPEVYSLERNQVYTLAIQLEQQNLARLSAPRTSLTDLALLGSHGQYLAVPTQQIHRGHSLVVADSYAYNVNLSRQETQSHLELARLSYNTRTSQHLVSFPDSWTDLDNSIDIAVSNSGGTDGNIKIVLNQGQKQWYDPASTTERHFPIMVQKDSRALLPAESQVCGGSRKRDATEMETSTKSQWVGDDWRAPKQRLIEHQSESYGDSRASLYASFDNHDTGGK